MHRLLIKKDYTPMQHNFYTVAGLKNMPPGFAVTLLQTVYKVHYKDLLN